MRPIAKLSIGKLTLCLVGLVYAAGIFVLPREGAWIVDTANKRIQVRSIVQTGFTACDIQWPGQQIDPDFAFNPLPHPFSTVIDGKLHSQYSPFFAFLSAPLYKLGGEQGLLIIPAVGAILALAGVLALAREAGLKPGAGALAAALAGLATPLWFYSQVFWEHTASAALLVGALFFAVRFARSGVKTDLLALSVLSGASVYFREETVLFFLVLWGVVLRGSRNRTGWSMIRSGIAFAVTLIPFALFLHWATGSFTGHHAQSNLSGIAHHLASRGRAFYNLFGAAHPQLSTSLFISLPLLLLFVLRPKLNQDDYRRAFPYLGLFALAATLITTGSIHTSATPMLDLLGANALFSLSPVLALGLLRPIREVPSGERPEVLDLAWKACVGYAAAYFLAAPEISTQGMHWGCRYLLPLYPLLALLAAANLQFWKAIHSGRGKGATVVMVLLIVSVVTQFVSLDLLARKEVFSQALNDSVRQRPEQVVISDVWWAPQEMYGVFHERPIFYTPDDEAFGRLITRLRETDTRAALFVTSSPTFGGSAEPGQPIADRGLNYFTLHLHPLTLTASKGASP